MQRTQVIAAGILLGFGLASAALAQPLGTGFTYQGELRTGGTPASGVHDLRFRLFDAPAGGVQVGPTVCLDNVGVAEGRFTVLLDFGSVFGGQERYLEIEARADTGLNCANAAGFVVLTPRQRLTGTPHALFALNAANATTATNATQLNGQSASFYQNAGNLTSGTLPSARLSGTYSGMLTFSNAGNSFTGSFSGSGAGLTALNASNISSGTLAAAHLPTGGAWSLTAPLNLDSGTAYIDPVNDNIGMGTTTPSGFTRLHVASDRDGIWGVSSASSGTWYGVLGQSNSASGGGLFGWASALSGVTFGVYAESASTSGRGVFGLASASTGENYGVQGESRSTSGRGVFGLAIATSGTTYGVFGQSNSIASTAYGVWAQGRLGASGTKSFRIDHPEDPEHRYLLHYAAESPEVINFYRGTVMLDERGEAVIQMPAYFARINRDPSYHLTAVGAPMPMLHVAEKIDAGALEAGARAGPGEPAPLCRFRIAGGVPGGEVSWEVKAVRHDLWVRTYGAPVEVEKEGVERGRYLHPGLYNQPAERGMNHEAVKGPETLPERLRHKARGGE